MVGGCGRYAASCIPAPYWIPNQVLARSSPFHVGNQAAVAGIACCSTVCGLSSGEVIIGSETIFTSAATGSGWMQIVGISGVPADVLYLPTDLYIPSPCWGGPQSLLLGLLAFRQDCCDWWWVSTSAPINLSSVNHKTSPISQWSTYSSLLFSSGWQGYVWGGLRTAATSGQRSVFA